MIRPSYLRLFFILLFLVIACASFEEEEERLIGWKGETHRKTTSIRGNINIQQSNEDAPWVEVISWEPRVFLYHNFLTPKECLYIIHKASPHMRKSMVVDSATGKSLDSRVRTSSGTFLSRNEDEVVAKIEKRIAEFSFIPIEHGEGIQVLHYEVGQKYDSHFDYFHDEINTRNGGQRIATMLMYLSDVEEGGETVFPSGSKENAQVNGQFSSSCGREGVAVRPKRGDAVLFWSLKPDASLDPSSLHGGCPVIKGNKWSATKWMRVHPME